MKDCIHKAEEHGERGFTRLWRRTDDVKYARSDEDVGTGVDLALVSILDGIEQKRWSRSDSFLMYAGEEVGHIGLVKVRLLKDF